jgi:tungstate transport system substrate-binding protein
VQAWQKLLIVAILATVIVVAGTIVYFNYFSKRRLFISTTTSLYDTGLLTAIENDYESTHNVDLQITAVGTGVAIQQAENGDADIVLVHAPSTELKFLEGGYGVNRKIIAYN